MEPQEAFYVWKDVVGKRWIKCALYQGIISSIAWFIFKFFIDFLSRSRDGLHEGTLFLPFLLNGMRCCLFMVSQGTFLLGLAFICDPQERDAASFRDLASALIQAVGRVVFAGRQDNSTHVLGMPEVGKRIRTRLDYVIFVTLCASSGAIAMITLLSSVQLWNGRPNALDAGLRGAALGIAYACLQFYRNNVLLRFPVIQRGLFFALKVGVPAALERSFKLSLVLLLVGEALSRIFLPVGNTFDSGESSAHNGSSLIWRQALFATGTLFVAFIWEVVHNMERVIQTEQHVFYPPLGSCEHDAQYTDLLLDILEDPRAHNLVQYHAFHDLCLVSETNVDTWRRAAIFEESGDSYKRVISIAVDRLDSLTVRLALCLDDFGGAKGLNVEFNDHLQISQQLSTFGIKPISPFRDFQVCCWCVRTVASLTASSRFEDPYGVAQLNGCNVQVVSSLLSCLLVVEMLIGRRSNANGFSFSPNSLSSKDLSVDPGAKGSQLFKTGPTQRKKAYAMADVLRTSLYLILYAFGSEIVQRGSSTGRFSIAERDWLSTRKPLFGDHEMHLQKLRMFAEYRG